MLKRQVLQAEYRLLRQGVAEIQKLAIVALQTGCTMYPSAHQPINQSVHQVPHLGTVAGVARRADGYIKKALTPIA